MSETADPLDTTEAPAPRAPLYDDEKMYLIARIADDLVAGLSDHPDDRPPARQMAWTAVTAYAPRSEPEVLAAARVVSLSLTQIDVLREARNRELTLAMKLRAINAAIALNRSVNDTERLLLRRQRADERRPARPPRSARPATGAQAQEGDPVGIPSRGRAALDALAAQLMAEMAGHGEPADGGAVRPSAAEGTVPSAGDREGAVPNEAAEAGLPDPVESLNDAADAAAETAAPVGDAARTGNALPRGTARRATGPAPAGRAPEASGHAGTFDQLIAAMRREIHMGSPPASLSAAAATPPLSPTVQPPRTGSASPSPY